MKITKLEKKKRLYLLETDQNQKVYITEDTIVRFFLSKDKEITEEELKEIQNFAQQSYGKNLALYYLSFKQRSKKEVGDYLLKHDISQDHLPIILDNLEKEKWIDDLTYSQNFLYQNLLSGDKGPQAIRQKLQAKGISQTTISQTLSHEDFSPVAKRLAEKLLRKYQDKLPYRALKDKILQNLIAKGFDYSDAKQSLSQLRLEEDQEQTQELIYKELEKQHRKYSRKYDGYELKNRLTQALARKGYDYDTIKSALRDFL